MNPSMSDFNPELLSQSLVFIVFMGPYITITIIIIIITAIIKGHDYYCYYCHCYYYYFRR